MINIDNIDNIIIIIKIIINNNKESVYCGESWQTLPQQGDQIDTKTAKSCW